MLQEHIKGALFLIRINLVKIQSVLVMNVIVGRLIGASLQNIWNRKG